MVNKACVLLLLLIAEVVCNTWPEYIGPRSVSISENQPVGAKVFNFSLFDADGDPLTVNINNERQFTLEELQPNNYSVKLRDTLDRETKSRYDLQITFKDRSVTEIVQDVRIRVQDVNDFTPIFKNPQLIASVLENQPAGTFVINITTEDRDMGFNAATEIFLDNRSHPFYLGDATTKQPMEHSYSQATVLLSESLDYESRALYQVAVTVRDMAGCSGSFCQTPLSSTQTLRVNVLDIQDTPPYFIGLPYVANTNENLPINSKITQVVALDGDTTSAREIHYYFVGADNQLVDRLEHFSINLLTGEISNAEVIDTDSEALQARAFHFSLNVMAKEVLAAGEPEQPDLDRATTTVSITVLDLNDEMPMFSDTEITATVRESLPMGSSVQINGTLRVFDPDQGLNGTFTLRVLDETDQVSPWFALPQGTEKNEAVISLTTKQSLDHESTPTLIAKIEAKDTQSGRMSFSTVYVTVTDSNDNSPTFSAAVYDATVAENSEVGTIVDVAATIVATDVDSTGFGSITYTIENTQNVFAIDPASAQVTVACDKCIDRETESSYIITIVATDGGGLSGTARLAISVTDVNDNAPSFSQNVYQGSIQEGSTEFTIPIAVEAADADEGLNSAVSYTLLNYTDYFSIDSNGTVHVTQALDAERMPATIDIKVVARDDGVPSLNSTATVRLEIIDLNDEAPTFLSPAPLANVSENAEIGTLVYTVRAVDKDRSSPNNNVTYTLRTREFGQFLIGSFDGRVTVNRQLDNEGPRNEYSLEIKASDGGEPVQSSYQTVIVKITDVNDELPVFSKPTYSFSIHEGPSIGVPVGMVNASDLDLNKRIVYSINSTQAFNVIGEIVALDMEPFVINRTSGVITVGAALDRETFNRAQLTVTAEDVRGIDLQIVQVEVNITILDVNDNPPEIEPVGTLEVEEGMYSRSDSKELIQLIVKDSDLSTSLHYSLSSNPGQACSVNSQGQVHLIKPIDRETISWLNLTVLVSDGESNALSSTVDIYVRIKDVNDEKPQFREFVPEIAIPESVNIGYEITRVRAEDGDVDPANRQVKYTIESGSLNKVALGESSGLLTVAGDLDRDGQQIPDNKLRLVIKACDTGLPVQCETRNMTIRITDVNDNTPEFTRSTYFATISENAGVSESILISGAQIEAIDIDSTPNGQNVRYSCCSPGNDTRGLFNVSAGGQVIVAAPLSGHSGTYQLTVKATDWGNPSRTGSARVIVEVQDFNDHSPVLTVPSDSSATVHKIVHRPENSTRGNAIVSILATDGDKGDNAIVDLAFITNNRSYDDYRYFYIERNGRTEANHFIIRQNVSFDRETAQQYKFAIVGRDRGRPQLNSSHLYITVNVDDANDNPAFFPVDKQHVKFSVEEGKEAAFIGQVNFTQDKDERQEFCYSIIGARISDDSALPAHEYVIRKLFTIDSHTAEIAVAKGQRLDREAQATYILVIQADDRDESIYSDCKNPSSAPWTSRRNLPNEMEVEIIVEDINDSPPVFSDAIFNLAVVRGVAPPVTIIQLKNFVKDPDVEQSFVFSRGQALTFEPPTLSEKVKVAEPIKISDDGDVQTQITFTEDMQGMMALSAEVTDAAMHSSESLLRVYIINSENTITIVVSKDTVAVENTIDQLKEMFAQHLNWNVSIISITENPSKTYHSDVQLFVVPEKGQGLQKKSKIQNEIVANPSLLTDLHRYGYIDMPQTQPSTIDDDEEPQSNKKVIIIAVVVAVVLTVVVTLVLVLCYIMRNRYKRKLKAAHAMAFDTHTLGFEIDQSDVPQSVSNIPGSPKLSTPVTNQQAAWNDSSLNNFDWSQANGAFDRESHRSSHSHDDNAIDPLNSTETQSCSSAGSNDWRLDLRGNNLDRSPPPPITGDDVTQSVLNEHNNQLNYDSKFIDSQSDRSSSSTNKDGHFNRLIMSDSVYGKIYETRRMPNGLETTEV